MYGKSGWFDYFFFMICQLNAVNKHFFNGAVGFMYDGNLSSCRELFFAFLAVY